MDRETRFTNKHSVPTVCGIIPAIRLTGTEPSADCRQTSATFQDEFSYPLVTH